MQLIFSIVFDQLLTIKMRNIRLVSNSYLKFFTIVFLVTLVLAISTVAQERKPEKTDYLSIAQGAIPVTIQSPNHMQVGIEHALNAIDGNYRGYVISRKPGTADTQITLTYKLPALTTFSEFVIPNVLETPSPSQTFFKSLEISGSETGADGEFEILARETLTTHTQKDQTTVIPVTIEKTVQWVKLTLTGGIDIQTEKTFFEFSEIIGHGSQEAVPLLNAFTGKWKGIGVLMELKQHGALVAGCYDEGNELTGSVSGNILRATGKHSTSGVISSFVLTVTDQGEIIGVRSTNGAPFKMYTGALAPDITTKCSQVEEPLLGCESVVHGINFDYDSATIRNDSQEILDKLSTGLKASKASTITVVGYTSNEGSDSYNQNLSQLRAESVVKALVKRGINQDRIVAQGRGEKDPIADNTTEAGRSLNRRVEIRCQ